MIGRGSFSLSPTTASIHCTVSASPPIDSFFDLILLFTKISQQKCCTMEQEQMWGSAGAGLGAAGSKCGAAGGATELDLASAGTGGGALAGGGVGAAGAAGTRARARTGV